MTQDARDHRGLVNQCDEPEPPTAARARENVEAGTSTHQMGPQAGTLAGRSPLAGVGRIGFGGSGLAAVDARRGRRCGGGDGVGRVPEADNKRSPSLDVARDGPEQGRRATRLAAPPLDHARGALSDVEGQDAVMQDQVDARPRDQDREALQEFDGVEHEVRRAIQSRVPEAQDDLPLRGEAEPVLRHRRSQGVPTELLETLPRVGGDAHARMEIDSLLVGVMARGGQVVVLLCPAGAIGRAGSRAVRYRSGVARRHRWNRHRQPQGEGGSDPRSPGISGAPQALRTDL